MKTSEQINELAAAMAAAQKSVKHAKKEAFNPHFKSKYANLANVVDACRDALAANGLSFMHGVESEDGATITVTCRVLHKSGQWAECSMAMKPGKADAQSLGSALSYGRRYTLSSMVGIATEEEDDDGNEAARGVAPVNRAVPGNPADTSADGGWSRKDVADAALNWSGVQPEDLPAVLSKIKSKLGINGTATTADYGRMGEYINTLSDQSKTVADL
jgi:hypothetical protein